MNPEDVAEIYLKQAKILEKFMENLKETDFTKEEYKLMLAVICQKYYELLMNLALTTPALEAYSVKFYKIKQIDSVPSLSDPPFDKDFFKNHQDI